MVNIIVDRKKEVGKNVSRLIGRWPYQNRYESIICSFIVIFLSTSQFYAEIVGVIFYSNDKEVVLESITPFMVLAVVSAKYVNSVFNVKTMVMLLERVKRNWAIYTKDEEIRILRKYAYIGQLLIYTYTALVYVTVIIFVTEPLMPKMMNYILQHNESIEKKYPVPIHWQFMDMEKSFYLIWSYESICIMAILTIAVANDSMFIIFLQHACALFTIVGHQFRKIPNASNTKEVHQYNDNFRNTNDIQYDYYVMCIKNHESAVEFAGLLENMYVWGFGVVIAINMPLMSVTAVQIATQADSIRKVIKYSMFTSAQIMHLYFDCYLSQQLTDCSVALHQHINQSNWIEMSLKSQKLVSMVILRSQNPCILTAGKLLLLSIENFGMIIKTAVSYFTVIISFR